MLEGVVLQGTGKAARMGGYRAAGKNGPPPRKIDEATGRYSQTRYVASFARRFAAVSTNPEIACVVSIDETGLARIWAAQFQRRCLPG